MPEVVRESLLPRLSHLIPIRRGGPGRRPSPKGDRNMSTKEKLERAFEHLTVELRMRRSPSLCLAHTLLESALSDFFDDPEDAAALPDEETVYIGEYPPLPRA